MLAIIKRITMKMRLGEWSKQEWNARKPLRFVATRFRFMMLSDGIETFFYDFHANIKVIGHHLCFCDSEQVTPYQVSVLSSKRINALITVSCILSPSNLPLSSHSERVVTRDVSARYPWQCVTPIFLTPQARSYQNSVLYHTPFLLV